MLHVSQYRQPLRFNPCPSPLSPPLSLPPSHPPSPPRESLVVGMGAREGGLPPLPLTTLPPSPTPAAVPALAPALGPPKIEELGEKEEGGREGLTCAGKAVMMPGSSNAVRHRKKIDASINNPTVASTAILDCKVGREGPTNRTKTTAGTRIIRLLTKKTVESGPSITFPRHQKVCAPLQLSYKRYDFTGLRQGQGRPFMGSSPCSHPSLLCHSTRHHTP